ncbi:MAG: hypothetical protein ASARMPRED_006729 [Alectoria sarmentosa]|nr:MAG: hypothetical protein ASARMPRED_006729 [Alectoria sarmentosa]
MARDDPEDPIPGNRFDFGTTLARPAPKHARQPERSLKFELLGIDDEPLTYEDVNVALLGLLNYAAVWDRGSKSDEIRMCTFELFYEDFGSPFAKGSMDAELGAYATTEASTSGIANGVAIIMATKNEQTSELYHTFIPTSIAFLCTFSSSVYTPGFNQVEENFGILEELALLPFVVYLLGLAFGPDIVAPSSETFGRGIIYQICIPIFAIFTLGAGVSQDLTSLVVCRLFAGLFSSPGLSVGTGALSDLWTSDQRGIAMAACITMPLLGPAMGPLIGGFVVEKKGWRWTQWTILLFTATFYVIGLGMCETYKNQILKSRAKKLGLEMPSEPYRSARELVRYFVAKTLKGPISMLCTEKIVAIFSIYVAFNMGLVNCFFAAFPYVFKEQYNFELGSSG